MSIMSPTPARRSLPNCLDQSWRCRVSFSQISSLQSFDYEERSQEPAKALALSPGSFLLRLARLVGQQLGDVRHPAVYLAELAVDLPEAVVNLLEPAVDLVEPVVDVLESAVDLVEPVVDVLESVVDLPEALSHLLALFELGLLEGVERAALFELGLA